MVGARVAALAARCCGGFLVAPSLGRSLPMLVVLFECALLSLFPVIECVFALRVWAEAPLTVGDNKAFAAFAADLESSQSPAYECTTKDCIE